MAGNTKHSVGLSTTTRMQGKLTKQTPTISYLKQKQISSAVERQ